MPRQVLLIDDDDDMLEVVGEILAAEGYEVRAFPSAELAVAEVRRGLRPAAILLDFHMPGLSASDVLDAIEAECTSIPVLLLSGAGAQAVAPIASRVERVLQKPVPLAELLGALDWVTRPAAGGLGSRAAGAVL